MPVESMLSVTPYVPVRMAVESGRLAMSGPPSVCDTDMRVEDLGQVGLFLGNELLELGHLTHLLEREDFVLLVSIYGEPS